MIKTYFFRYETQKVAVADKHRNNLSRFNIIAQKSVGNKVGSLHRRDFRAAEARSPCTWTPRPSWAWRCRAKKRTGARPGFQRDRSRTSGCSRLRIWFAPISFRMPDRTEKKSDQTISLWSESVLLRGSILASHPAAPGLIPGIPKKISEEKLTMLLG